MLAGVIAKQQRDAGILWGPAAEKRDTRHCGQLPNVVRSQPSGNTKSAKFADAAYAAARKAENR